MSDIDEIVQLVTIAGERHIHPDFSTYVDDIGMDDLRKLYEDMVVVRRLDAEATALQRQGQLGLWAPLLGQEAAQIGSARALEADDFVFPSYREHGVAYCRGVELAELMPFWRGTSLSGWDPNRYNMATPAIIIGAQTLHAAGYGMGITFDGAASAVITYFGDGATSQGDVAEAMGFAASFAAPVVFFCQNNQWAISEPVTLQSKTPIAHRGRGYGMPTVRVDGNDVLAVLAVTRAALELAREGGGPTFIEAVTYRRGPHTTSDDPTRYRTSDDDAEWIRQDPIERIRLLLESAGALSEDDVRAISEHAVAAAAELRRGCLALGDPPALSIFDNAYAEPHAQIEADRRAYAAYLEALES
ncbi:pyruvate dehydrogenase (acetyl-transferring) E1 component subunit alpha [Gordonia sp. (in: high G+C Gram-positive bacteria)]|uniref:pyruvate dehydrogenase (acetyl-transferring) E1 component subunit alpha n=1 Tax=Gordonia sp. (in: high G+C Gram-positive bacteria) TaxID=84139 RepID=UPI001694B1A5|nr:pyruvate dehydrogenase (acetyl-transferring) E1 component subunit alpha [Gordonia sp. (in: high G+C Gram-positive bacteria)]NLG47383.1 pyruvate dehydrogenase (acetyl-transferring) E1 component subunit alpha [Gordonia sp. (in: high G+C Gram-positive bacteria)]